jgi:hypothetical protein
MQHMGKMRNVYRILVGKPEGKKPLRRHKHRWEDTIKMDLRKMSLEGADCINLAQVRGWWWALVNMIMNLQVP